MCRLFIANQKDYYLYDRSHGILHLMEHLEKQCGGHGNGYALVKDKQIIKYAKGESLTNEEIYHAIKGVRDWDYVLYHTRIASIGNRSDSNCHPFIDNDNALAMNGTAYEFNDVAEVMEKTDTELIFKLIKDLVPTKTTQALAVLGAIFVGFSRGKPYAVKGRGDLACYTKGSGSFHASTFPKDVPHKTLGKGYIWLNGNVIQKTAPVVVDDWRSWGIPKSYHSAYSKDYVEEFDAWGTDDDVPTDKWETGYEVGYQRGYYAGFNEAQDHEYVPRDMNDSSDPEWLEGCIVGSEEGYAEGYDDGQIFNNTGWTAETAFSARKQG